MIAELAARERRVYSQWGEDGALERLFELFGTTNRYYVEFGAADGFHLSNTANLRIHHGWTGLLLDGSASDDDPLVRREFITAENVNEVFGRHGVPESFDLLSLDIDGNDYWVWKALRARPRVVVIEYNIHFGLDLARTIEYDADFVWDGSLYCGASLAALRRLGDTKGYALIYTDRWSPNAFFVLRSELPPDFVEEPIERVTDWCHYSGEPKDPKQRSWVRV